MCFNYFIQLLKRALTMSAAFIALATMGGCSSILSNPFSSKPVKEEGYSPRVVNFGEPVPKGGGRYKLGSPYTVGGITYRPHEQPNYDSVGIASWYGKDFHGRLTANGETYDMNALTAAHTTLPIPSLVEVENLSNGRKIVVRVNDRGPYAHNRVIDMSARAAKLLGYKNKGTQKVRVRYVGRAPLDGNARYERHYLAQQTWTGDVKIPVTTASNRKRRSWYNPMRYMPSF